MSTATGGSGTKTRLDRSVVIDAAFAIVDREGLDALTIRRLAQSLSVTPMALYWHFKDKDALLGALGDHMWEDVAAVLARADRSGDSSEPGGNDVGGNDLDGNDLDGKDVGGDDPDGWAPLRHTMAAMVEALRRHPAVAQLAPARVLRCDAGLDVTERTLDFLTGVGFGPRAATQMAVLALQSAIMLVGTVPGADTGGPGADEEHRRAKRMALASLPPGRYPLVTACFDDLLDCDEPDDFFTRGIDVIVAGARSQAAVDRAGR